MAADRIFLMEVFNIVYLGRDKVVPAKQFGTITMKFHGFGQDLYNVKKEDVKEEAVQCSSFECKDDIVVAIKAPPVDFTKLDLKFDLFDSAYKGSIIIEWDPDDDDPHHISLDRKSILSADGFGSISVLYGLFGNATVANVEIKSDFDVNVHGVVAAYNSKLDHLDCVSMLLVKKPDNMIEIRNGQPMLLSRSRVAVPLGSKFYVYLSLHAADNKVYRSTVDFNALKKGSVNKDVSFDPPMEAGKINVKVTWKTNLKSIGRLYDNFKNDYRDVFQDFDPVGVAKLNEKRITAVGSSSSSLLSELKLRVIIENALQMCKIIDEFGSFDKYIWGFVNHKPTIGHFRYPRQVPIKTSKADVISKDLVKRGFRGVGPTVVYSFMQVAGITNDHLISCFRFQECISAECAKDKDGSFKDRFEEKQTEDETDLDVTGAINGLSLSPIRSSFSEGQ